jgi:hypothetical protein
VNEKMLINKPSYLISWLQCLDIEYIGDVRGEELSHFDINDPLDQNEIIDRTVLPEFRLCNDISKKSMIQTLKEVSQYPESEVRKLLLRINMPFKEPLYDYVSFFEKVRRRCEGLQGQGTGSDL